MVTLPLTPGGLAARIPVFFSPRLLRPNTWAEN